MSQQRNQLALWVMLSTLLLPMALPTSAKPSRPQPSQPSNQARPASIYDRAKKELPEDHYVLYRIVDRLARANGLEERPWRIIKIAEYNINAFATEVNLIAVYSGLLDQLAGDASAIACIVAHEMAHHTKRHIALGPAQEEAIKAQLLQEAKEEATKEVNAARSDIEDNQTGASILRFLLGNNTVSQDLEQASRERAQQTRKRVEEIFAAKQAEFEQRKLENERKQEFEADEVGYQYLARAGFDAQGCFRVMDVLSRTPGAEFDTTHPAVPKRIERLNALMRQNPPEKLVQDGQLWLNTRKPLTYDLSQDGQSLRVNSRRGGSAATDIDRLFGK